MGLRQKLASSIMSLCQKLVSAIMNLRQKLSSSNMSLHQKLSSQPWLRHTAIYKLSCNHAGFGYRQTALRSMSQQQASVPFDR